MVTDNTVKSFTSNDITNFLKQIIEIGGVYKVDDKAMVLFQESGEPAMLQNAQGTPTPLSVFYADQVTPGTIIINPFAEGVAASREIEWFYLGRSQTISQVLVRIMHRMLVLTLPENADTEEIKALSATQVALLSPLADKSDKKMLEELAIIGKDSLPFFNLHYVARKATVYARAGIFEEATRKEFPKIRKKTWPILMELAKAILGTDDLKSEYVAVSTQAGCGRLYAYCQVFAKLIKQLMPYWDFAMLPVPDLEQLIRHVSMIPLYYTRAKNVITPILTEQKSAASTGTTPWSAMPTMGATSGLAKPFNPSQGAVPTMVGASPLVMQQPQQRPQSPMYMTPGQVNAMQYAPPQAHTQCGVPQGVFMTPNQVMAAQSMQHVVGAPLMTTIPTLGGIAVTHDPNSVGYKPSL